MRVFLSLLRTSLLTYFGLTAMKIRYIREKKRLWEPLLIGFAMVSLGATLGGGMFFMARALAQGPEPALALTLAAMIVQMMALLLGFFALISVFYFSSDLDILVALPLREGHILAAKFTTVLITEYVPALLFFAPALAAYAGVHSLDFLGWVVAVFVFILLPVTPLALAGVMSVTMMRGLNRRHRDIMMVIASLLLLAGILYFQYAVQAAAMSGITLEDFLFDRVDLVSLLGRLFPPSIWATRAITEAGSVAGLANLALLLVSAAVSIAAFVWVGQKVFYGGLIGGAERDRKGMLFSDHVIARRALRSSALMALLRREWLLFIRVPIWVMNGFIAVLIVPLLMFFPANTAGQSIPQLAIMVHFAPNGLLLATLVASAVIGFMASLNTLASTSLSREGKHLWISRALPVPASQQVTAKLLHAGLGAAVAGTPIAAAFAMFIKPGFEYVLAALLLGLLFSAAPQIIGLLFDMWRPLLGWTNPQHAVKNNLNAVMPLLIIAATGLVSYGLTMSLLLPLGLPEALTLGVLALFHGGLAAASLVTVLKLADRLYVAMEDK